MLSLPGLLCSRGGGGAGGSCNNAHRTDSLETSARPTASDAVSSATEVSIVVTVIADCAVDDTDGAAAAAADDAQVYL